MSSPTPGTPTAEGRRRWRPDEALPPGYLLRDELSARNISQAELAVRTGLSPKHINQVINGVVPLSAEVALVLERVLGVPSHIWNGMESKFRDSQVRHTARDRFRGYVEWARRFPISELIKYGKIAAGDDGPVLVGKLLAFFGVANPEAFGELWNERSAVFRRTTQHQVDFYATATWLRLAELAAAEITLKPFDGKAFAGLLPGLRALTKMPLAEALPELQQQAAATGVAVVRIPEIPGARACGATRWNNSTYPIVVLSGRYKTEDSVWFSFFHEAGHITRHARKMTYIRPKEGAGDDELETEANQFAADTLIPPTAAAQLGKLHTASEVTAFANQIGVDPGIVAGRLSNDKMLTWAQTRKLRRCFN
jgi:HTH-type transcriptional regulator / antitoxin HigA